MASTKQIVQPSVANAQRYTAPTQAFHEEIAAFYSVNHSSTERTRRSDAFERAKSSIISRGWKNHTVDIKPYGSAVVGTFLRSSDIDVVVIIQRRKRALAGRFQPLTHLRTIKNHLAERSLTIGLVEGKFVDCWKAKFPFEDFKIIEAEVPILQVTDVETGIKVDISCVSSSADHDGLRNSAWIKSRIPEYPNLPKITVAVKELLRRLEMNSVVSNGISSYCLTLMVLGFLQHNDISVLGDNLGDLLLKFLKWYAKDFNSEKFAIVVTGRGQLVSLEEIRKERQDPLYIQDPIDSSRNAAGKSSKGILPVKAAFALIYFRLNQLIKDSDSASAKTNFLHTVFEI